ncbi:Nif3-like dinuclear metal center hexameric protein [Desulfovibrio mangrovi]|uniref:Nif3-like dinuclear metal center hexameric protein n=1 Tax=Desulfovibrio mangrovi TaxID=2976983 RepID=UPI0022483362|nr:Nif3-like dinuclear metal center hexameric protein [Desulfovibrio mangrovi]UZP68509.1 Nif3-like dinuclear metal center hexameric protein [Desulfovibrio mangrovi]
MKALELISAIEHTAIPAGAASWDKCGVQVAGRRNAVRSVAVALDPTLDTIERALALGVDFILTHHPLSMQPRHLDTIDDYYRTVAALIESKVWLYSAHTTLDANPAGPVSWLADELALEERRLIEPTRLFEMESFAFAVPAGFDMQLLTAWSALEGTDNASRTGEMILVTCRQDKAALLRARIANDLGEAPVFLACPAQKPAALLGFGCIGTLPEPMTYDRFCDTLANAVERDYWVTSGHVPGTVSTVAYCTGSGSSLADAAFRMGADVFITGDVKYHTALDAIGCLIDVGHFSLEEEMMRRFAMQLGETLPDVQIFYLPAQDPMRLAVRDAR